MHTSTLLRMEYFAQTFLAEQGIHGGKVLDIGSQDVNGSYKQFFPDVAFQYTGLDMVRGKNVDFTPKNPYSWDELPTGQFDIVITGQTFEHAEFFWITMKEMARVLKVGGYLCIVVPNTAEEHRYPVDCYRFYTDGMLALAKWVNMKPIHASVNCAPANSITPKNIEWYSNNMRDAFLIAQKVTENIDFSPHDYVFKSSKANAYLTDFFPMPMDKAESIESLMDKNMILWKEMRKTMAENIALKKELLSFIDKDSS